MVLCPQRSPSDPKTPWYFHTEVGCGIWGTWYGYQSNIVEIDQVWVDKATNNVLREEGFREGKLQFVFEYGDWETLTVGSAPRHVMVTLSSSGQGPWTIDMKFTTLGGKTWMLDNMTNTLVLDSKVITATAKVSDVSAAAEKPM